MMLDATAGNRMMWKHKNPPDTIFLDKEVRLRIPPDIFAVWENLPFRNDVFNCVIFDPPHSVKRGVNSYFNEDPKGGRWYGAFRNKMHFLTSMVKASSEFLRVSKRLCFKWYEGDLSLWNVLPLFSGWKKIFESYTTGRGIGRKRTYWVTFIRSSLSKVNRNELV